MLTELRIRNFAIIEAVTLPLAPGFNVLSGETGAGKSIIVGALGVLLGERGSAELIRTGAERASVEGVFECSSSPDVTAWLDERGTEVEDGIVVLRRELVASGRGRAWINGSPVTAGVLAALGRLLVNLHGQHEAQTLLAPDAQRSVVDAFSAALECAGRVREAFDTLAAIRAEITVLTERRDAAERRADYLRHVTREIEMAKLREGEGVALEEESRRLTHVESLHDHVAQLRHALEGAERSALSQLASARKTLAAAARLDPTLSLHQESLESALVGLEELVRDLTAYDASLESDPGRLAEVERRRDLIRGLTRKYGGSVRSVAETLREARQELDVLDTAAIDLEALSQRRNEAESALGAAAAELTRYRTDGAERLSSEVDALLPDLGLPGGRFIVALTPHESIGPSGAEDVDFRVSLNVGHDARPLARIASGGELSRLMLALKTILARLDRIPTLVFDEVDSGIGGAVALQVGDALRRLSAHHQVFVITHLAQIAARAHHHNVVAKGARGGVTTADIAIVSGESRVAEVARMLGGDPESDASRAHARELLDAAEAGTRKRVKARRP